MTDQNLDHLEVLANQKRGRGYHEEQILTEAVPALIAEVRRLRADIEQGRGSHKPGIVWDGILTCAGCSTFEQIPECSCAPPPTVRAVPYPCPAIRALDGENGDTND